MEENGNKEKPIVLKGLPLLSQGHCFVLGECGNGLIQGDRVELRFGNNPWIPAIIGGLGGMSNLVLVVDLVLREEHYFLIKKSIETSKGYDFRFVGRKGYSKENCQWSTREEQMNNTRHNHLLTFRNKTLTIAEWARELNVKYYIINNRIYRGWSIERALTFNI